MPHDREQLRLSLEGPHSRHPPLSHRARRENLEPAARREHLDLRRDGNDPRIGAVKDRPRAGFVALLTIGVVNLYIRQLSEEDYATRCRQKRTATARPPLLRRGSAGYAARGDPALRSLGRDRRAGGGAARRYRGANLSALEARRIWSLESRSGGPPLAPQRHHQGAEASLYRTGPRYRTVKRR